MPHIDMTVQMLRDFGATVHVDKAAESWRVEPGTLRGQDLVIEPDLSNASPFLSIAMVCGGSITIVDWPKQTTQPGDQLRDIFTQMGARVEFTAEGNNRYLQRRWRAWAMMCNLLMEFLVINTELCLAKSYLMMK